MPYRRDNIDLTWASHKLVFGTGEPAYAVDRRGEILAWNNAATKAFGYPAAHVLGESCWRLLRGRDMFGNDYCGLHCPHRAMAARRQPIHRCHLNLATATGGYEAFTVSTLPLFGQPGEEVLIHLCRPVNEGSTSAGGPRPTVTLSGPSRNACILTPRETEVIRALADGRSTREIGILLGISVPTVRNHVEHLLHKLDCHSRLEAVAMARRLHII